MERDTGSFLGLLNRSELLPENEVEALRVVLDVQSFGPDGAARLAEELVQRSVLTAWQAEMLLKGKHKGFRLGPYKILQPLGQGGMGRVFLAEHEMMGRRCAIKLLPGRYQGKQELIDRFRKEARAVAALDHPHIIRAYDFNKDVRDGTDVYYLVMEYVEGQDLDRLVREQGVLDYRKASDFIRQAALGLAHAHEAGFVHRDVKPANLLVDPHGMLKILDLGLAAFTYEAEKDCGDSGADQSVVGTADYVAPEQLIRPHDIDCRADIYSLGYTFYYLLVGRAPFVKPTVHERLTAHLRETPDPIRNTRPDVPAELVAVIDRMTEKKRSRRYQTAKEVAETLEAWLENRSSATRYSHIPALKSGGSSATIRPSDEATLAASDPSWDAAVGFALLDDEMDGRHERSLDNLPEIQWEQDLPAPAGPAPRGGASAAARVDPLRDAAGIEWGPVSLAPAGPAASIPVRRATPRSAPGNRPRRTSASVFRSPWLWAAAALLAFGVLMIIARIQ
jgi:serine/threonine-protein kinase